jgi:hypothetical protein
VIAVRYVTLQPAEVTDNLWSMPDGEVVEGKQLPYPFHVREDGTVARQDVWQGDPTAVVGFAPSPDARTLVARWADVWADPNLAVGRYVVTTNAEGTWSTWQVAIESATEQLLALAEAEQ